MATAAQEGLKVNFFHLIYGTLEYRLKNTQYDTIWHTWILPGKKLPIRHSATHQNFRNTQCDWIWLNQTYYDSIKLKNIESIWHKNSAHLEKSAAFWDWIWIPFSQPVNSCLYEPNMVKIPNKHDTNTDYKRFKIQKKKQNKYILIRRPILPICQMLFTGSRLNPKAVKHNIFLLSKSTVNWKDFQHCELKRRTSMFTFSTQASQSKRHQSIFGWFCIHTAHICHNDLVHI